MNKKITASELFLALLALLLIGVSFYQTWLGLQQIFGPASFVIALVLSLLLLYLLWEIRKAKLERKPTASLVWIYVFVASFCFIANFNALYTRFMKTDIYTEELKIIGKKLNNLETAVNSKLDLPDSKIAKQVEEYRTKLRIQIVNEGNPGIGPEARKVLNDLQDLTGKKFTPLYAINKDFKDLALRMDKQVENVVYGLSPSERDLQSKVSNASLIWNKEIENTLRLPDSQLNKAAQGQIEKALAEYNKLGNEAQTVLGVKKLEFTLAESETHLAGKLSFSIRHAIKNFGVSQFVVLAGCILLDFVIVIIILFATTPRENSTNGSVIGKKGTTLG